MRRAGVSLFTALLVACAGTAERELDVAPPPPPSLVLPEGWPGGDVARLATRVFLDDADLLAALERPELDLDPRTSWIHGLAVAPSGELVLASSGDALALWRVPRDGGAPTLLDRVHQTVEPLAWHPSGRLVVAGSRDGALRTWRVEVERERAWLMPLTRVELGGAAPAVILAFGPDGTLLVGQLTGRVGRWSVDAGSGALTFDRALNGAGGRPSSLTCSPDGRRALVGGAGATAELWSLEATPRQLAVVGLSRGWVSAAAFSPDGRRVALGGQVEDGRSLVAVHDLTTHPPTRLAELEVRGASRDALGAVAFAGDDLLVVSPGAIERWRLSAGAPGATPPTLVGAWRRPGRSVLSPADVSPDGAWVVGHVEGTPGLWRVDAAAITELRAPPGPPEDTDARVLVAAGGRLVRTGPRPERLRLEADPRGVLVTPIGPDLDGLGGPAAALSPDGALLVSACAGKAEARLWALEPTRRLLGELGPVEAAAFAPDGRWLLTVDEEGTLTSWRVTSGAPREVDTLAGDGDAGWRALRAAAGRVLTCGHGRHTLARVADDGRLTLLARWPGEGEAELSPDGRLLLAPDEVGWREEGPDGAPGARLWRLEEASDGSVARRLVAMLGSVPVAQAAFSPDGAFAATAHTDGGARVWRLDPAGGAPALSAVLHDERGLPQLPAPLAFSEDGELLFARTAVWRHLGSYDVRVGADVVRLERPRAVPAGQPRLQATATREGGALVVRVANGGDAAAHELVGAIALVHSAAPLGEVVRFAVGTVPPGGAVVRRVSLPPAPGLRLREITWRARWGRTPPRTRLEEEPGGGPSPLRRQVLREAAALALDLRRSGDSGPPAASIAAALLRDGELDAALQLDGALYREVAEARARRGDLEGARAAAALETFPDRFPRLLHDVERLAFLAWVERTSVERAEAESLKVRPAGTRALALGRVAARARKGGLAPLASRALEASLMAVAEVGEYARRELLLALLDDTQDDAASRRRLLASFEAIAATSSSDELRLELLRLAAAARARLGDREDALARFGRLLVEARERDLRHHGQFVTRALRRVGLLAEARARFPVLRAHAAWFDPTDREDSYPLGCVLDRLLDGDVDVAREVATTLEATCARGEEGLLAASITLALLDRPGDARALGPRFHDESVRITAILEVARVQATAGDLVGARATAATASRRLARPDDDDDDVRSVGTGFDASRPDRWDLDVDVWSGSWTMSSLLQAQDRAQRLLASAMRLHVRLGLADADAFVAAFDGQVGGPAIQRLARAQTSSGDPEGAKAWVDRLRDPAERAHGLLGIGEGLLPVEADPWDQALRD